MPCALIKPCKTRGANGTILSLHGCRERDIAHTALAALRTLVSASCRHARRDFGSPERPEQGHHASPRAPPFLSGYSAGDVAGAHDPRPSRAFAQTGGGCECRRLRRDAGLLCSRCCVGGG